MTLDEKITTVNLDAPAPITVQQKAGDITEAGYAAVVDELVARYDAKAAKRARLAAADADGE